MILETKRLTLIEISQDDFENIHDIHSVPEVDKYNTLGIPASLEETKELMQPDIEDQVKTIRSRFAWKIIHQESKIFVGLAGMFLANDKYKMGEFYYKFYPKYWGNGFATEVARELIRFGFETCNLHRIEAGVATENIASIRVLEKAGMSCEGIRRKILPIRGEWKDNFHYAILEDDFFGS